jgi:membrane-associated phospholipid phosphatase
MKKQIPYYFIFCLLAFWTFSLLWLSFGDKISIHKTLTQYHSNQWDLIFQLITFFGDGIFLIIISFLFLLINIRTALLQIISYALSGLLCTTLKYTLFSESKRPYFYLKDDLTFHKIIDFTYFIAHSFPSGHTTSIFAIMTIFALTYQNSRIALIVFFLFALLVAYSRIYLSQHFLIDVVAGSFLGSGIAYLVFQMLNPRLIKFNVSLLKKWKHNE